MYLNYLNLNNYIYLLMKKDIHNKEKKPLIDREKLDHDIDIKIL